MRDLIADLRRRRVMRVMAVYAVMAWIAIEVSSTAFPLAGLPDWTPRLVLALAVLGLPAAIVLAWAYDVTPGGVQRTPAADPNERWRREQELLAAAIELPAGAREAFVESETSSHPGLRKGVLGLLAAHARTGVLDDPVHAWLEAAAPTEEAPVSAGRRVGHYEILDKLGGGGMGVVYRARDVRLERFVALKFLPPHMSHDNDAKQRFMAEAQAAAALDHTHICTLLEIGHTEDDRLFLAMPYYGGETLKSRLSRGPLALAEALDLAVQASLGLAAAHARGIIHRDIKPANLIVTGEGVLKILDFGIAKLTDAGVTEPGIAPGTVAYMSPEQARGEVVDSRTDVWSLGVVLYEALTGQRPFRGGSSELVGRAILDDALVPVRSLRRDVPEAVDALVSRALARDRDLRYETGTELHTALAGVLAHAGPETVSDFAPDEPPSDVGQELRPEGERRQATIVVSTLGGYSQLVETVSPDELRSVLDRIRSDASEIATRFGGVVNRADEDRVEMLFGVPVSHEDHCFRGVRAALELHERVRCMSVPSASLQLHSGADTGLVIARPRDEGEGLRLAGGPAISATRLQARAGPDELWITASCKRVVGAFFETSPGEPMSLVAGSVITPHRVQRLSGLRTRIEAAERAGMTQYVGRRREVARLRRALDEARGGRGGVVAIVGEAGAGKSRLLYEFRASTDDTDLTFLEGRCQSFGVPVAYLPFTEVLRGALEIEGVDGPDRAAAVSRAISRIGPELAGRVPLFLELLSLSHPDYPIPRHLRGDTLKHAMKEALAGLITVISEREPLVLLLEDWHWADEASSVVLDQIAEVAKEHSLLVVITARPPAPEVLDATSYAVVSVEPLDADTTAQMLRALLRVPALPPAFANRIHQRTAGNPFFIEEVARTLMEEGTLSIRDGSVELTGSLDSLQLPETVEAVIRARLDRLDRDTRDVVRVASVIGREFERRLLEQSMSGSRLPHAIQALKAAGLIHQLRVVPDAEYRFNHVLTQEVAYASLLRQQRVEVHQRVGEAIERVHGPHLGDQYDRLAAHFSEAGAWSKAVRYALQAAERKTAVSAFGEALRQLHQCEAWIEKLEDQSDRRDLLRTVLLRQERLCESLGLRAKQQEIIDRLLALLEGEGDAAGLAQVHQRQGDLHTLLHRFDDSERSLAESLRLARASGDPVVVRNTLRSLGLLRWHQDRLSEALPYIEEAIAIDEAQDDPTALVGELSNLAAVLKSLGRPGEARERLEQALGMLGARGDGPSAPVSPLNESYILHTLANVHRELGDTGTAIEYLERARGLTDRERMPIQLSYHYTSLAHLNLQQGGIEEALDLYRQAVDISRRADFALGLAQALRMLGGVLVGLDRYREALPTLREAAGHFAQLADLAAEAGVWRDIARCEERQGDGLEACAAWERAAEAHHAIGDDAGEAESREGYARCARIGGKPQSEVRTAYLSALACARRAGADEALGRLLNVLGIMAWEEEDYAEASSKYHDALQVFRELEDADGIGLMLNSLAMTYKASGRPDDARARLQESLPIHRVADNKVHEGHALAALGDLELESGNASRALEYFEASLALRTQTGDRRGEGWMHSRLASAHVALRDRGAARKHVADARRCATELGAVEIHEACDRLEPAQTH